MLKPKTSGTFFAGESSTRQESMHHQDLTKKLQNSNPRAGATDTTDNWGRFSKLPAFGPTLFANVQCCSIFRTKRLATCRKPDPSSSQTYFRNLTLSDHSSISSVAVTYPAMAPQINLPQSNLKFPGTHSYTSFHPESKYHFGEYFKLQTEESQLLT